MTLAVLALAVVVVRALSSGGTPAATAPETPTAAQTSGPLAATTTAETTTPADGVPALTVQGNRILRDGVPWWLLGYNSFTWSANCGHPEELMTQDQVDQWLSSMRHDGHGAVRLFFFQGWSLERLDALLASAERNNIYVILTIDNALPDCGEERKTAEWFRDSQKAASYQAWMTTLLQRYKGNTTIAWFEYFNEPGWEDGGLLDFITRMHDVAVTIDPDRLWSSGTIAPYAVGGPDNFRAINESRAVDIVSLHEYDFRDAETHFGPATRENAAGKPVLVGEFGVIDYNVDAAGCQADIALRADRVQRKAEAYITVDGYVGALAWSWQPGRGVGPCSSPGVDQDQQVQDLLRTITR
ncbi:cellulase family glycosylhydrolase [Nakamurella flava]|uniref:cellulase family glycosylhydrolase n=1 Tax=Nakamurella flava TaxID=2576308 RepID=UPI00140BD8CD|nr:cellulase family glycosylhydrolase [Nakamurella flava]